MPALDPPVDPDHIGQRPQFIAKDFKEFMSGPLARRLVKGIVDNYNNVRLNRATAYTTAEGRAGRAAAIDPRGARPEVERRGGNRRFDASMPFGASAWRNLCTGAQTAAIVRIGK